MNLLDFKKQLNEWGQEEVPFLFIVDFECEKPLAWRLNDLDTSIVFDFNGFKNYERKQQNNSADLSVKPVSFENFKIKFNKVKTYLNHGDTFLTNLTFKSELTGSLDLNKIFHEAVAKYKMCIQNQFLFFSPETFIQIEDGIIKTFPMKGTIDASINNASEKILSDPKESAEHVTIVDLLRNDLARVATEVEMKRFRYIESIKSNSKTILQVSSEISGKLPRDYKNQFGDILLSLLPAGSISGAPKNKTVEIIREIEEESRGYYTGVAGIFDGKKLDSCVMIRFIEIVNDRFYYRSGGGITSQSDLESEYQEMLNKIYVPIN